MAVWYPPNNVAPLSSGDVTVVALSFVSSGTTLVNAQLGNDFRLTLTDSTTTLGTPSNPTDGQRATFQVTQGGSGSYTLAYASGYEFSATLAQPTLSTSAGAVDVLGFIYNAAKSKWLFVGFQPGF